MNGLQDYERAKLEITVFDNDRIHTDLAASNGDIVPWQDGTPIIFHGTPLLGLSDLTGNRNSFNE